MCVEPCDCVWFMTDSGRVPVKDFADGLSVRTRLKFLDVVDLLETHGRRLSEPHAKYVGDSIFELRFHGGEGNVRVLYFFYDGDTAVLTNGFVKKEAKLPQREKALACERRKRYYERKSQRSI